VVLLTRQRIISSGVIPANAGIQTGRWMPDQVRHDAFAYLIAGLINCRTSTHCHPSGAANLPLAYSPKSASVRFNSIFIMVSNQLPFFICNIGVMIL
jgi:hypothetical protein